MRKRHKTEEEQKTLKFWFHTCWARPSLSVCLLFEKIPERVLAFEVESRAGFSELHDLVGLGWLGLGSIRFGLMIWLGWVGFGPIRFSLMIWFGWVRSIRFGWVGSDSIRFDDLVRLGSIRFGLMIWFSWAGLGWVRFDSV
jgi:hypothetical protein